mmetsp:Transcript_32070/g.47182  ORF Transcript_32070/g.47182 Transcript_32070/m.47182 type:complete len:277 (-) Transcript_32070:434-1264(-)
MKKGLFLWNKWKRKWFSRQSQLHTTCDSTNSDSWQMDELAPSSFAVTGNVHEAKEAGKFFTFRPDDLNAIVGTMGTTIVDGQFSVFRGRNLRTEKEYGVLIWTLNSSYGYGSWNPSEFSSESDWLEGDVISLLDYETNVTAGIRNESIILPCSGYTALTPTGWNLPGDNIQFGKTGLVGGWWKELKIEYKFKTLSIVTGVWSDSIDLPYSVKYLDQDGNWSTLCEACYGSITTLPPTLTDKVQISWQTTDFKQSRGLSTYRSGGGFHAEPVGTLTT